MSNKMNSRNRRQPAAASKAAASGRNPIALIVGIGALAIVAALIIAVTLNQGSDDTAEPTTTADADAVVAQLAAIPLADQTAVGPGAGRGFPTPVSGTAITVDGKPEILYVGAEYCPFCAAERWPLLLALTRFGSFSHVGLSYSAAEDVHPNTPTVSFHGSSYRSDLIAFTPVETASNELDSSGRYAPLDVLTPEQQAIIVEIAPDTGIPFVDFGGSYMVSGAGFDPGALKGMSHAEIASTLATEPTGALANSVFGIANGLTAAICDLTDNQPTDVCTDPAIAALAEAIG